MKKYKLISALLLLSLFATPYSFASNGGCAGECRGATIGDGDDEKK